MTVLKSQRTEGRLQVLVKAKDLAAYTVTITKNENIFPKRNRWLLTSHIVDEALNIFGDIRKGNSINTKTKCDFEQRRSLQISAYGRCETLLSYIDLAYTCLGIEARRVEHWTALVVAVEDLLQAWTRSDLERYKEFV